MYTDAEKAGLGLSAVCYGDSCHVSQSSCPVTTTHGAQRLGEGRRSSRPTCSYYVYNEVDGGHFAIISQTNNAPTITTDTYRHRVIHIILRAIYLHTNVQGRQTEWAEQEPLK